LFLKYANCLTIGVRVDVNLKHPTLAVSKNNMIKLFSPDTEIDLAILKSLPEAEKIHYYVKNDHFGSLRPGPQIYLFNDKTIYVSEADLRPLK